MLEPRMTRPTGVRRHRSPVVPPAPPPRRPVPATSFCAMCWGAGRIHVQARNGEGLVPVTCRACGGGGTV
ncbi:MAG: hypothetical protein U0237_15230 [Thermoleophilia bacterium]